MVIGDRSVGMNVLNIRGCNGLNLQCHCQTGLFGSVLCTAVCRSTINQMNTPLYPKTANRTHVEYGDIMASFGFSVCRSIMINELLG